MASVITAMAARIDRLAIGRATKSINEVTRAYRDTLIRWVVDAANGNMTAGAMASAWRPLSIDVANEVYTEGMREGGIKDPEAEMDDTDTAAIGDWILSQTPHFYPFADDCVAVSKLTGDEWTAARTVMLGRVDTWVASLEALGRLGTANTKGDKARGRWVMGDTEHCLTCQWLSNQHRRIKWFVDKGYIPRQPGSQTLDCHGFNCQCSIISDSGERIL